MTTLVLTLFGGFQARLQAGSQIALPTRKAKLLLARLALPAGTVHSREHLAGMLWSDRGHAQARASLRQALTALRKAQTGLERTPLQVSNDGVWLAPEAIAVDVGEFERLAGTGAAADLRQAAALYRGPLLHGFRLHDPVAETWLAAERARLHERQLQVLAELLENEIVQGMTERVIDVAQQLVTLDPLREDGHRALMQTYAANGQRGRAMKQFQLCVAALQSELGVAPEAETERLHAAIRSESMTLARPATSRAGSVPPQPVKPSLAVLPFTNLSDDPEQSYFSDGITEDIITRLSHVPTLLVIARNSSFAYRDKAKDVTEVSRGLGVHFVVEGSVRKAGRQVRITVQLVDGVTGHHIWAERYDRDLEDIFALQDEVTQTIVATLVGRLEVAVRRDAKRKNPDNLASYDHVLRGNEHFYAFTKEDNAAARDRYRQAVLLDPDGARAHLGLAWTGLIDWICHWSDAPEDCLEHAFENSRQALSSNDSDSLAHAIRGELHLFRREYEQATIHLERALALNPNDADAIGIMGFLMTCLGRAEDGIQHFRTAKRLNPYQPDWCMFCWRYGIAQYTAGHFDTAIHCMQEIVSPINDVHGWLAAAYAQAGRLDEARATMDRFLARARTEMSLSSDRRLEARREFWARFFPFRHDADLDRLLDGLRASGLR